MDEEEFSSMKGPEWLDMLYKPGPYYYLALPIFQ